ncbi:hypothetical protein BJX64DRAFT_267650 [Aspergillus heterothallicus]
MEEISVEEAQAIIKDVQITNGGISPDLWRGMPQDQLRALRNLQTIAGSSIEHVADDLYDTDTRFIFELIQNAEDNRYTAAEDDESEPFLDFTLHEDRLTVDSNEDGFSEADVRAICSIHQSSKKQVGGYIGHKGIGFKSVFKIAYKVCIQSGPFCFYFEHRRGDGGLAMITPYNEPPQDLPASVRTRITLWLLDRSDFATRARELEDIPDTLLLFLRKLRRLSIEIPATNTRVVYERAEDMNSRITTLTKSTRTTVDETFYRMQKQTLTDLPSHQSRQNQQEADLILAFPIDETFKPVIEPQFVYSFLPMRSEGFSFLIQSDFITQASRQSIHRCARNDAIRQEICKLFVEAVEDFCEQPALRHEWLQYLPSAQIYDEFWAGLREMIFEALKETKVLFSIGNSVLERPVNLHNISSRKCDRHGKPLLDDLEPAVYLSKSYRWSRHIENLRELGVTSLPITSFLDRLEPYLQGNRPRYLDSALDDDWHEKVANVLVHALKIPRRGIVHERIKKMPLIPAGGSLCSADRAEIYFPDDDQGNPIPVDLKKILLIDREALENPSRRKLVNLLGVTHCKSDRVVKAILQRYNKFGGVTLANSVSHLCYLFRVLGKDDTLDLRIFIMDQDGTPVYRAQPTFGIPVTKDDLYFETLGDYGTRALAQVIASNPTRSTAKPDMHLIHSAYIAAVPAGTVRHRRTWEQWLEEVALVRRIPRLKRRQGFNLSDLAEYLTRYNPLSLLGVLKEHWASYASELTPNVVAQLKEMQVPCMNKQMQKRLEETSFPSTEMRGFVRDAGVEGEFSYFLALPDTAGVTTGWKFLAKLGVTLRPTIKFFFHILEELINKDELDARAEAAIFRVYRELAIRFSDNAVELQLHFKLYKASICIPKTGQRHTALLDLKDVYWQGHRCLPYSLAQYAQYTDDPHIAHLFKRVLRVHDADLFTYMEGIEFVKTAEDIDPLNISIDDLGVVYQLIEGMITDSEKSKTVREHFADSSLVYLPVEDKWLAPDECLWTETQQIGPQFGISRVYPELEDFFRKHLKVSTPTAATYIGQLKALVSQRPGSFVEIKSTLHKINSVKLDHRNRDDLLDLKCLPVALPGGRVKLLNPTDTFFIADRIDHLSIFEGKVPFLDLSLKETRQLRPLLLFLGLQDRYTSTAVKEETVVEDPTDSPSSAETRAFRRKTRHIRRCVLHYKAAYPETGPTDELDQLKRVAVYLSDGFKKTLQLRLNDVEATVESDTGLVHINVSGDSLRIYIPRGQRDRQRCYSLHLPQALVDHFGLRDPEASLMFQLVFVTSDDFIDDMLDRNGIIRCSPEVAESEDEETQPLSMGRDISDHEDVETVTDGIDTPRSSSVSIEIPMERRASHHRLAFPAPRPVTVRDQEDIHPTPAALPSPNAHYIQVLDDILKLAGRLSLRQAIERTAAAGRGIVAHESAFGVRSDGQIAHDIKIGAAGELFVFELLLRESLPGYSHANWRSTIRKEVSVHPEYQDLRPWYGSETADIVYYDTQSAFTRALVDMGFLQGEGWLDATPTYYIEVKTTKGGCSDAFFMSRSQYSRMESMRIAEGGDPRATPEIYIIFRVYNLGKDTMRAWLYVDPASLRDNGTLKFVSDSFRVFPSL